MKCQKPYNSHFCYNLCNSMSKLSRDDVLKLARLSRLRLSAEEVEKFAAELSAILDYVEMLDKADTTGLEPTYQLTGLTNVTRPDEIKDYGYKLEELLKNAPALEDNQFKVKRVLN
jgi:aspartyl-tRNA(Asn)/glutamyl-tRNA(Gln) amidotransferase subunit C